MTFPKPDESYWNNKLAAYLHDPIDKVFGIKGHEERAAKQLEAFGLQKPNEAFWKRADGIAASFERGQVPSYSKDPSENGAIDFIEKPVITHPTARDTMLEILLPENRDGSFSSMVSGALLDFLKANIGMAPGSGGYSNRDIFSNNPQDFAFARFLYIHHGLRFKLAENDVAGLGGLWHRLPADSRFPDHTIWQHNALTAALYSCMDLANDDSQVGIMNFSIIPVQPFIAKARKLRDYWTGSVLLSWLAYEGLLWIFKHLGPDHLIYPSPVDQPLVNEYLRKKWEMNDVESLSESRDIASLPNKFLFLIPLNHADSIAKGIRKQIQSSWRNLCDQIVDKLVDVTGEDKNHLKDIFHRQTENYWDLQWTSVKLIDEDDIGEATDLLSERVMAEPKELFDSFGALVREKWRTDMDARGIFYSSSHQLAQKALAVSKMEKKITRPPEPGQKCHLCAEYEVLHAHPYKDDTSAGEYKSNIDTFWKKLSTGWGVETDFDDGEKLCALCLVKRIAYYTFKEDETHILHACFKKAASFPSTTEMALYDYFKQNGIFKPDEKRKIAQQIHEREKIQEVENRDRYYAILVMDGDHMGKLINGETMGATWSAAMHPEIKQRLQDPTFEAAYRKAWTPLIDSTRKRLVTPAIHAAISESLADFSIYGVSEIVERYEGRLIYAGGDDVCAVLPVSTVVKAAREISEYYTSAFKLVKNGEKPESVDGKWNPVLGKLSVCLGKNAENSEEHISISAGIVICHHKEELGLMIRRAHLLLDQRAKIDAGRNACAVELRKRSGGSRYFVRKWNNRTAWEAFDQMGRWIKVKNKQQISTSLIYRLEQFRDGIAAILKKDGYRELMHRFVRSQLDRSSISGSKEKGENLAAGISEIILEPDEKGNPLFRPEALIVAAFIADRESEVK